jgi:hypothetical protein
MTTFVTGHTPETLQSLISYDVHMYNVQRFHNLRSTLQGAAKALPVNLPVTSENFTVAGQLINRIYNPCQLCQFP